MKVIAVASRNPVKSDAALSAFGRMFPGEAFTLIQRPAESGVAVQPTSDAETLRGACNRAAALRDLEPTADFWVGIEGGVEDVAAGMCASAWVVVESRELSGRARSGTFFLPPEVARLVRQGRELGDADDKVSSGARTPSNRKARSAC